MAAKWTNVKTSGLRTFPREPFDGSLQLYSTQSQSSRSLQSFHKLIAKLPSFLIYFYSKASTPWGSTVSLFSSSLQLNNAGLSGSDSFSSYTFGGMFPRNLYRLLAVVVHSGEANSGHFVTYRRGALRNSHRYACCIRN